MSIRFLLGVAVGAAGGYAAGRIIEARAHGVPLDVAFKNLGTSVMELRQRIDRLMTHVSVKPSGLSADTRLLTGVRAG